jgi:hypothetical protein
MAKYDQGGGCPCGLYAECDPGCRSHPDYVQPQTRDEIDANKWRSLLAAIKAGDSAIIRALLKT